MLWPLWSSGLRALHAEPGDTFDNATAEDRVVSGYLLDPGPAQDLTEYSVIRDDVSDHPWAKAVRQQRLRDYHADQQRSAQLEPAEPDDVMVARYRRKLVTRKRVAEDDYEYPPHLIGPGAAAYPPPPSGSNYRPPLARRRWMTSTNDP